MKNLMFIFITIVIALSFYGMALGYGTDMTSFERHYEEIEIKNGDTLWSIAKKYSNNKFSTKDYVLEIMKLNNMNNDKIISGHRIIIPIYK